MPSEPQTSRIVFLPSGKHGTFANGTPILSCARQLGVDIDSVCGGRGICGRCQVLIAEGDFAKHGVRSDAENVSARGEPEDRFDARTGLADGRRLSCHALLEGDLVIDVPAESQVHKQVVRKRAEVRDIEIDPALKLYYVEVEPARMDSPTGDAERLADALTDQWGLSPAPKPDLTALQRLGSALRDGKDTVTVAVYDGDRIVAVWPGFTDRAYGVAFDIGSTTIAGHLCDLATGEVLASAGAMNPQIRFGEDLMSRVSYVMLNPGGDADMTAAVRTAINDLCAEMAASADIDPSALLVCTLVGNPIMHHLLLGIDPTPLGGAPFALAVSGALDLAARDIGLGGMAPGAQAYLLPCIAGHVGADTAAVILSEEPHRRDEISLIVDVGTNAEIVLGNRDRLLAASSPTGPAFEGAQVSAGQRAAPGAIERVRIDPNTWLPRFKVIGCDVWSDEPGFADAVSETGVTGICGSGIIEAVGEMFLAGILAPDGVITGNPDRPHTLIRPDGRTFSYVLSSGEIDITVTQNDVRAIQLAKAALYAGCALLMDKLGIAQVDRIVLAGAFGSHIDPTYALLLGMVPDCPLEHVSSAGNAAGTGARIALLNRGARSDIEETVRRIEKIETAVEPAFQAHFVDAMALPHAKAAYTHLEAAIPGLAARRALPASSESTPKRRRRRR